MHSKMKILHLQNANFLHSKTVMELSSRPPRILHSECRNSVLKMAMLHSQIKIMHSPCSENGNSPPQKA